MNIRQYLSFFAVLGSILLLAACGSNSGSGGDKTATVTPTEAAAVGITNCAQCHAVKNENWLDSPHGNPNFSPSGVTPYAADSTCGVCHNPLDDGSLMPAAYSLDMRNVVGCESCHGGGEGHAGLGPIAYPLPGPEQCSQCHSAETEADFHATTLSRIINDTHYDDPATENVIEGYVVKMGEQTGCQECHFDTHILDMTINDDWGNSAHAGGLMTAKDAAADYDAAMVAGVQDSEDGNSAWAHYDWDSEGRQGCQRCHTSTGVSNFLDNPADYDPANNDFSHLAGWSKNADGSITSSGQNEMLYCWGCHSDNTGSMRNPGALTIDYAVGDSVDFRNSAASNACISCHSGTATGDSIKISTADGTNVSFVNSHYLAAAGVLFATGGYEYAGQDYAIVEPDEGTKGDQHQYIGYGSRYQRTGNANYDANFSNDYMNGPCATCHFSSDDGSHTLSPFTTDSAEGEVLNAVCVACHSTRGVGDAANTWYGKDFTADDFVTGEVAPHKGRMLAAQMALDLVLQEKGIHFKSQWPYFFNTASPGGPDTWFSNWASVYPDADWKDVMGAAFNLNFIAHDPAATAHNRRYARRLLYDAIDFMDDGIMNDSTNATVTAQGQDFTASALNYIGSRP